MAKFNTKERMSQMENESIDSKIADHKDLTKNYAGGIAFNTDKYIELYTSVCTCLYSEPKYYTKTGTVEKRILQLIKEIAPENPEFLLKLAVYARTAMYLRSTPMMLLGECSLIKECKPFIRRYTPDIIRRADELKEAVAYIIGKIGDIGDRNLNKTNKGTKQIGTGSLPAGFKKGLADSFSNFNAYSLAKYNSRDDAVKLRDVLRLTHPKPQDERQSLVFKQLRDNTLPVPETWETIISAKGSKKENWEEAVQVMPIFALIRNLRNLLDKKIDNWDIVKEKLTTEKIIRNSKLFPYRFFSAYREIEYNDNPQTRYVMEWLEQSMDLAIENMPHFKGKTAGYADNSGSMFDEKMSLKSKVTKADVANLNLAMLDKMSDWSTLGIFGLSFAVKNFPIRSGILHNALSIKRAEVGLYTNAYLGIKYLNDHNISVDRVLIFSDCQCYDTTSGWQYQGQQESLYKELLKYKHHVNPNVYVYSFNLSEGSTAQFPQDEPRVGLFGGYSDKVFHLIETFEKDSKTALDEINAIVPRGKRIFKAKTDSETALKQEWDVPDTTEAE